jgi:hypothetical protein
MSLPTKDKTWLYNVNQDAGGTGVVLSDNQNCMLKIKNALIGFSSVPWTVWGSCNGAGVFGNNDGVDRWAAIANLVWAAAASNHSWIVLEQAGLGGAQMCIDLSNAGSSIITLSWSPGGQFGAGGSGGTGVDGTATARPTAGDELNIISATTWGGNSAAYYTKGLHVMQSSDGQCTRVLLCMANVCSGVWFFEKAKNPITAWTAPYFAGAAGSAASAEVVTYVNWNDSARVYTRYPTGTTSVGYYMTSAFYGAATVGENQTYPDDNTLEWPMNSIGLASLTATHRGGRKGEVFDLWWGSTAPQIGATYPEDGTKQFAQFGHLIFPWDGASTPKTA